MRIRFMLERPFMRHYSLMTGLVLILALLSSLLGLLGGLYLQVAASSLLIVGVFLLVVQIVLVITRSNRNNPLGWIVHRLAYVTLFVVALSFLLMLGGILISSLQIAGSSPSTVTAAFSAMATSAVICFGICLCAISYHALRESEPWRGLPA